MRILKAMVLLLASFSPAIAAIQTIQGWIMQRRQVIQYLAPGGTLAGAGGGYLWLSAGHDHSSLSIPGAPELVARSLFAADKVFPRRHGAMSQTVRVRVRVRVRGG